MAYPSVMVAALSGATLRQLGHWRRQTTVGAVLIPELSATRPILYSFRDVLAARACAYLRKDASLQKIRTAIGTLRRLGETEHLSSYKLVADDAGSIVLIEGSGAVDLVKRPGQRVIAEMSDILRPFVTRSDVEIPALLQPRRHVSVDPRIRSGFPIISGTRVPYDNVASLVADGVPTTSISNFYPAVSAEAAADAFDFSQYVDRWRLHRTESVG